MFGFVVDFDCCSLVLRFRFVVARFWDLVFVLILTCFIVFGVDCLCDHWLWLVLVVVLLIVCADCIAALLV